MANLQERRNKERKLISYSIRVHRGRSPSGKQLKPYSTTFEVNPTWTETSALKKVQAFEQLNCKEGNETASRVTFREYCEYVLDLKEKRGVKRSTLERYRELCTRIYRHIGDIKLKDFKAQKLNSFYNFLLFEDVNLNTGKRMSEKTVIEHHRLISSVLEQALKEGEVSYNAAKRAEPPKLKQKTVNYFQPEELTQIKIAISKESLKYQVLFYLFVITGARRGEIVGLKWEKIDFENKVINFKRRNIRIGRMREKHISENIM